MIVEFSVKNFRSIKDLQTLSFVATGLKSPEECKEVDINNIAQKGDIRLLRTIGLYGPNGSGKSNIIRALDYFIDVIRNDTSNESMLGSLADPFLYQDLPDEQESFFQIVALVDNKKFRYGFTVRKNPAIRNISDLANNQAFSKEIIVSEWLFGQKEKNMVELFTRENGVINKSKLDNKEPIPELSTQHNLFLTYASAFDKEGTCAIVRTHLVAWTISNFKNGYERFRRNSLMVIDKNKESFLEFLSVFNLKYSDIELDRSNTKPDQVLSHDKVNLFRKFTTKNGVDQTIRLNLQFHESSGTQKLFDLAGVFLRAFQMPVSGLILIDEVDSHFHPSLLLKIVNLINSSTINAEGTQLVFSSHDTNMLSPAVMRRDQFYFTEKRTDDSTRLYSLADLRGIRNDADFARQYLAGFYGAIPLLEDMAKEQDDVNVMQKDGSLEY